MRFSVEVIYTEGHAEDVGAVAAALADVLFEQEGVTLVVVHGPEAKVIPSPTRDVVRREED